MTEFSADDLGIEEDQTASPEHQKKARVRSMMRKKYAEQEPYRQVVDAAVRKIVEDSAKDLIELITLIDSMITVDVIRGEEGVVIDSQIHSSFTDEALDFLCIKLASLGVYVQQQVDKRSLDADIAEHMKSIRVAEELEKVATGEGAARDSAARLRQAQREAEAEEWVSLIKRNAYQSLRHLVDRSERLYEALKKAIDRRRDEYRWGGKAT